MGCCQNKNEHDSKLGKNDEILIEYRLDQSSKSIFSFEANNKDSIYLDKMLKHLKSIKSIDIVFLIDCTASMKPYLSSIKKFLKQIVSDADSLIRNRNMSDDTLNIGCVTYRDHTSSGLFISEISKQFPFNCSFYAHYYIDELNLEGGEDDHEAVADGLYDATYKLDWNEKSEKFLLHFCDAPPHGSQYATRDLEDNFIDGCPCGKNEIEILSKLNEMKIRYIVVKLNNSIDKMIHFFNQYINVDVITPDFNVDITNKFSQYI